MSQRAFAKAIGVAAPTACEWESGRCQPSLQKLQAIATLFECTIDDLVAVAVAVEEDTVRDNTAPEAA
jgi:transcriptional regulator with XRE-family HTH domain